MLVKVMFGKQSKWGTPSSRTFYSLNGYFWTYILNILRIGMVRIDFCSPC